MKKSRAFILAASFTLFMNPAPARCEGAGLQGRWKVVSMPAGWKKIPGINVVISSGQIRVCVGKISTAILTYTADPATGKVEAVRRIKGKAVVQRGVYRQSGDTLTLSVSAEGKPAPANPDCTDGGAMRWVFRKA
jgi:hypothetical protein